VHVDEAFKPSCSARQRLPRQSKCQRTFCSFLATSRPSERFTMKQEMPL
jgi:hypothetical protein